MGAVVLYKSLQLDFNVPSTAQSPRELITHSAFFYTTVIAGSHSVVDHFYTALFCSLKPTHCAPVARDFE